MRKTFLILVLPLLLLAATGPFIDGQVVATATHLYNNPTVIHLPCGIDLDTRNADPELSPQLMLASEQEGIGTYLIQFDGPIYAHERRELERAGVIIEGYLPNYAYIARMDQAGRAKVLTLSGVKWVGDYEPGYKLCPEINYESSVPQKFVLTLYAGIDGEAVRAAVEDLGGEFLEWQATDFQTFVHIMLAPEKLTELVHEPEIKWVEPYRQPYLMNGLAQWVIQTWETDNHRIWDEGLTGEGQIVATLDSGIRTTHNFFRDPSIAITDFGDFVNHRKIIAYQKPAYDPNGVITFGDESGHGTHTAGSAVGNDGPTGGSSVNDGMAPDARIYFLDGGGGGGGIIHAVSLEYSLSIPYNGNSAGGARIMSNSWGNQTTRNYDKSCMESDQTMWNRPQFLVMFSAGNNPPGTYTGSPANAKNVVAVGGCRNGSAASFFWTGSSVGPSADGRIRPDIVTPGNDVTSSTANSDDSEATWSGTSMAAPIANGNAALIRQYFVDGWYPSGSPSGYHAGFEPSAALIKGMLVNTVETDYAAVDERVPSNRVGWGRPKLDNSLYFPGDDRKLAVVDFDEGLETGYQFLGTIDVDGDGEPLRVTLNWTDYPGQQYASPALVNDLNLEVISPSGKVYRGNNFENNVSTENGDFDTKNPIENVFVDSPETGEWEIRVQANNVPSGPQPFALVVTGELNNLITSASISDVTVNDNGQSNPDGNMDPGEDVTLYVEITNSGSDVLHNVTAALSSSASEVTVTDNSATYGTISAGGVAQGDGFGVTVSASAAIETWVEFELSISSDELSGSLGTIELMIGTPIYDWVSHDVGNLKLTVTKQGAIGYLGNDPNDQGDGFRFPKDDFSSLLYHASLCAGTSAEYMNDRLFDGADWEVSADPNGMVIIGRRDVSDQDSRAIYTDAGHDSPQGLRVWQYGYAWSGTDYVILKFVLENTGGSDINGLYAGIVADFDMGANSADDLAGTDQALNLAFMRDSASDNPHVAVQLLDGPKANVSIISNPDYVWDAWDDDVCYRFLSGALHFDESPNDTDWSITASAGPIDLAAGATDTIGFAMLAGESLSDLKANAGDAEDRWVTLSVKENNPAAPSVLDMRLSPSFFTGKGAICFSLPAAAHTRIDIFDISGRRVRTLINGNFNSGQHEIYWNGKDHKGHAVSKGVYFVSLTAGDAKIVHKAVIVR